MQKLNRKVPVLCVVCDVHTVITASTSTVCDDCEQRLQYSKCKGCGGKLGDGRDTTATNGHIYHVRCYQAFYGGIPPVRTPLSTSKASFITGQSQSDELVQGHMFTAAMADTSSLDEPSIRQEPLVSDTSAPVLPMAVPGRLSDYLSLDQRSGHGRFRPHGQQVQDHGGYDSGEDGYGYGIGRAQSQALLYDPDAPPARPFTSYSLEHVLLRADALGLVRDRPYYRFKTIPRCIAGKDLVELLLWSRQVSDVSGAMAIGQALLTAGLMSPVGAPPGNAPHGPWLDLTAPGEDANGHNANGKTTQHIFDAGPSALYVVLNRRRRNPMDGVLAAGQGVGTGQQHGNAGTGPGVSAPQQNASGNNTTDVVIALDHAKPGPYALTSGGVAYVLGLEGRLKGSSTIGSVAGAEATGAYDGTATATVGAGPGSAVPIQAGALRDTPSSQAAVPRGNGSSTMAPVAPGMATPAAPVGRAQADEPRHGQQPQAARSPSTREVVQDVYPPASVVQEPDTARERDHDGLVLQPEPADIGQRQSVPPDTRRSLEGAHDSTLVDDIHDTDGTELHSQHSTRHDEVEAALLPGAVDAAAAEADGQGVEQTATQIPSSVDGRGEANSLSNAAAAELSASPTSGSVTAVTAPIASATTMSAVRDGTDGDGTVVPRKGSVSISGRFSGAVAFFRGKSSGAGGDGTDDTGRPPRPPGLSRQDSTRNKRGAYLRPEDLLETMNPPQGHALSQAASSGGGQMTVGGLTAQGQPFDGAGPSAPASAAHSLYSDAGHLGPQHSESESESVTPARDRHGQLARAASSRGGMGTGAGAGGSTSNAAAGQRHAFPYPYPYRPEPAGAAAASAAPGGHAASHTEPLNLSHPDTWIVTRDRLLSHRQDLMGATWREGWLTKEGHLVRNWKKRWFVLRGCTLSYYRNKPADAAASGGGPGAAGKAGATAAGSTSTSSSPAEEPLGVLDIREYSLEKGPSSSQGLGSGGRGSGSLSITTALRLVPRHHSEGGEYLIVAENEAEFVGWVKALSNAMKEWEDLSRKAGALEIARSAQLMG